jgi:hypothetical protein
MTKVAFLAVGQEPCAAPSARSRLPSSKLCGSSWRELQDRLIHFGYRPVHIRLRNSQRTRTGSIGNRRCRLAVPAAEHTKEWLWRL